MPAAPSLRRIDGDYFDHPNTVGFTRSRRATSGHSGLALPSNGEDGEKVITVGVAHANETWHEITGSYDDELTIGDDGVSFQGTRRQISRLGTEKGLIA